MCDDRTRSAVRVCRDGKAKASKRSISKNNTSIFNLHKLIPGIAEREEKELQGLRTESYKSDLPVIQFAQLSSVRFVFLAIPVFFKWK